MTNLNLYVCFIFVVIHRMLCGDSCLYFTLSLFMSPGVVRQSHWTNLRPGQES